MASPHGAGPATSTSTGTPAAVRTDPHRVVGTLAVGPGVPSAEVVRGFPGEAPQPVTALAASTASTLAATARE
jgi:hypothetical protein